MFGFHFSSKLISYRFHMVHSTEALTQKETLFISQPDSHRVIKLKSLNPDDFNLNENWEAFIGNGERCLPGDADLCGDGGRATNARLSYPKGK